LHISDTSEKKRLNNIIAHTLKRTNGTEPQIEAMANAIFTDASIYSAESSVVFKEYTDESIVETLGETNEQYTAARRIPQHSILSMKMTAVNHCWLLNVIKRRNGHAVLLGCRLTGKKKVAAITAFPANSDLIVNTLDDINAAVIKAGSHGKRVALLIKDLTSKLLGDLPMIPRGEDVICFLPVEDVDYPSLKFIHVAKSMGESESSQNLQKIFRDRVERNQLSPGMDPSCPHRAALITAIGCRAAL
jgi:hypothetical protein